MEPQDGRLKAQIGPVDVDWPGTAGYYGGIAAAVAFGLIEPPLAIFIAAVPFVKLFNRPDSPLPSKMISQFLDGLAKPVGGDGDMVVKVNDERTHGKGLVGSITSQLTSGPGSIWSEARALARTR